MKQPLMSKNGKIVGLIGNSIDITEQKKAQREAEEAREREQQAQQEALLAEARAVKLEREKIAAEKQALEARERELHEREQKIIAEHRSQAEREMRACVTIFAGSLSHDLKNSLHGNGLALEMMAYKIEQLKNKYQIPEEELAAIYHYQAIISQNGATMTGIIDTSTQMIQQIAAGEQALALHALEVEKLLRASLTNYQRELEAGTIQWKIQDKQSIQANYFAFLRVMMNLLDNAKRQIQQKGQGQIFINAYRDDKYYIIDVKDTAGGLTQADIDRLFTLYKTKEVQGTGIGLPACQLSMQQMNGTLTAHLVEGDCIVMRLRFPI